MDTNSLVRHVKDHLECIHHQCMDMDMDMVHSSNLDSYSYSRNAALDVDDDVDNSMDHMDKEMDMDKDDLDRLMAALLHVFSSLVLDDKQTTDEIREYVADALYLLNFAWAKHC